MESLGTETQRVFFQKWDQEAKSGPILPILVSF
nr:MAG TPA_asm: hypothetical protein [Caudoviricetes sp.]